MITVVAGVARDGNKVLVFQRRGDQKFPYQWEFPGGKVEVSDETLQQALIREWMEELEASIIVGDELVRYEFTHLDGQTFLIVFFSVTILSTLSLERFEDSYFCPIHELRTLNLLEGDLGCVRELEVRWGKME